MKMYIIYRYNQNKELIPVDPKRNDFPFGVPEEHSRSKGIPKFPQSSRSTGFTDAPLRPGYLFGRLRVGPSRQVQAVFCRILRHTTSHKQNETNSIDGL